MAEINKVVGIKKKVYMYDLNGIFIREFSSVTEVERWSNSFYLHEGISRCCRNKSRKYKDKIFKYYKKDSIQPYTKPKSSRNKKVYQFDIHGNLIESYESVTCASKVTKTSRTSILGCLSGIYKSANGYLWSYSSNYKMKKSLSIKRIEIQQLDNEKQVINTYVSCSEAERVLGLRKGAYKTIYSVLNSNKKRYSYYWIRKDNHVPSL